MSSASNSRQDLVQRHTLFIAIDTALYRSAFLFQAAITTAVSFIPICSISTLPFHRPPHPCTLNMAGNNGKRSPSKRKDPPPSLDLKGQSSLSAAAAPFKLPGGGESAAGEPGMKPSEAAAEQPPSNDLQPHASEATVSPTQTTRTPRSARLPASNRYAPGIPATPGIEQSGIDSTESSKSAVEATS